MELQKEWLDKAEKIMAKYPKEEGEQEYYMYYDVDVPKMLNTMATEMLNAVEALVKTKMEQAYIKSNAEPDLKGSYLVEVHYYQNLLTELKSIKPNV